MPALARTLRYGDVRGTDVGRAAPRSPPACSAGSAPGCRPRSARCPTRPPRSCADHIDAVHAAVALLDDDAAARALAGPRWRRLAARRDLHGLLAGRLTRLLLDAGRLDADEVRRRLRLPLTVGTPPAHAAAWVEGFLAGGGLLLVHDDALLALVDDWLAGIAGGRVRRRAAAAAAHVRRVRRAGAPRDRRAGAPVTGARPGGPPSRRTGSTWTTSGRPPVLPTLSAAARPRDIRHDGGDVTGSAEAAREERLRRWRLVLGGPAEESLGVGWTGRDGGDGRRAGRALRRRRTATASRRGDGRPGSARPRRRWRAGSATSASTSRAPSCR